MQKHPSQRIGVACWSPAGLSLALTLLLMASTVSQAAIVAFKRYTSNSEIDISSDVTLVVTDLGDGVAQFEIERGETYDGFIRNVYFEDQSGLLGTITFEKDFSSSNVKMLEGSAPARPPGISDFTTVASFSAAKPAPPKNSIGKGDSGTFLVEYSGTFEELEAALFSGEIRVAVHMQGLVNGESDTLATIPEPSSLLLMIAGGAVFLRRSRARPKRE